MEEKSDQKYVIAQKISQSISSFISLNDSVTQALPGKEMDNQEGYRISPKVTYLIPRA